jgi:hypothetical protein
MADDAKNHRIGDEDCLPQTVSMADSRHFHKRHLDLTALLCNNRL